MASDESSPNLRALEFASQTSLRLADMGLVAMRYLVVCAVPYGHRKTPRTRVAGYGLGSSRAFEAPLNCDFQFRLMQDHEKGHLTHLNAYFPSE